MQQPKQLYDALTQLTVFTILIIYLQVEKQDNVIVDLIQEMVFIGKDLDLITYLVIIHHLMVIGNTSLTFITSDIYKILPHQQVRFCLYRFK